MSVWIMKLDSYRNGSSAQPEKRTWAWVAILFSGVGRSKLGLKFVITQQNPSYCYCFLFVIQSPHFLVPLFLNLKELNSYRGY